MAKHENRQSADMLRQHRNVEKEATDQRTNRETETEMYRFFLNKQTKKKQSYGHLSDGFNHCRVLPRPKHQHHPTNLRGRNAALPVFLDAILLRHCSVVLLTSAIDQSVFETGL